MQQAQRGDPPGAVRESGEAIEFVEALGRTLGGLYRLGLYRTDPPELIHGVGPPRRSADDPIPELLAHDGRGPTINHSLGRRSRVSVLSLPGTDLALVVEVDLAGLSRASRVLKALADPQGDERAVEGSLLHVGETLDHVIALAEERIGVPLREMSRTQKQEVVKLLDQQGIFLIKKAVEDVASRLGVSRFTVYNYLDQIQRSE